MNNRIERLIVNYFDSKISEEESKELADWIEKGNRDVFNQYVILNFTLEQIKLAKENRELSSWEAITSKINQKDSIKVIPLYKRNVFKFAIAASIVLLISLPFVFNKDDAQINEPVIVNHNIKAGTDKATLTLENGETIALEKGKEYIVNNIISNGEKITYEKTAIKNEIAYNYLTIPRGGQFQLTLSDGTKVWLNSETQLKYPVSFPEGENRQVELVYGEAYFEVSSSTMHNGANFKVINNSQEVEVLGTQFNVKAYKDETMVYTTLVEGKVTVETESKNRVLKPNQQSTVSITDDNIVVVNIKARDEIAWINGEFILQHKNLKDIMKVLSRWYDMDVVFVTKELEDVRFVGVLGKDQSIVDILNTIKSFGVINNYEINNKKVILK